jgi:zinc finger protein
MSHTEEVTHQNEQEQQDDDDYIGCDNIESLCLRCYETGITRLMIHKVPYFRELIIASFDCEHCGEHNNEVTFGGAIQSQGSIYELTCLNKNDLNRQIIKSDYGIVTIPCIEFEIPSQTQKGEITTIEGILTTAAKNLTKYQPERMEQMPEVAAAVEKVIVYLNDAVNGECFPFTIVIKDCSGNSFVENLIAPLEDPQLKISYFPRTAEDNELLGLAVEQTEAGVDSTSTPHIAASTDVSVGDTDYLQLLHRPFGAASTSEVPSDSLKSSDANESSSNELNSTNTEIVNQLEHQEVMRIPQMCPSCFNEGESLTAVTTIPHFKEVIIMAYNCASCGFRTNEIKAGGGVPTRGTSIELTVSDIADLSRDVLKGDHALVEIPQLDLILQHGTLGGVYTTVEGLLLKIYNSLSDNNPFYMGDSTSLHHSEDPSLASQNSKFHEFLHRLMNYMNGLHLPFTIILRDPLGNSFVSPRIGLFTPPEMDQQLLITEFDRTFEENEDLGLNDINTADYEVIERSNDPDALQLVESSNEIVLSDRLLTPHIRGADHPMPFVQGVRDNTEGGIVIQNTQHASTASKDIDSDSDYSSRHFNPQDMTLKFIPYEEFSGRKVGYVYRLGGQGLGYYEDAFFIDYGEKYRSDMLSQNDVNSNK